MLKQKKQLRFSKGIGLFPFRFKR